MDRQIGDYCSINKEEKKSLGELEGEFLAALQSFYYDDKPLMSNEEFDNLKEELQWQGSRVVIMSKRGNQHTMGTPPSAGRHAACQTKLQPIIACPPERHVCGLLLPFSARCI